jgi:opacity protein-like surface antigen
VEAGFQINKRIYLVTGFELFSNRLSFEHTPYNLEKIIAPDFQTDSFMVADRNRLYVRNTFAAIPLIGEAHFGKGKLRFVLSGGGVFLVRNTTSFESEKSRYSYDFGETKPFGGMLRFGAGVSYALTNNLQLSFTGDYRSLTGNLSQKSGVQFAPENSSAVLRLRYLW